jgi:hypothetical protein
MFLRRAAPRLCRASTPAGLRGLVLSFGRPAPFGLLALLAGFDCLVVKQLARSLLMVALFSPSCVAIASMVNPCS